MTEKKIETINVNALNERWLSDKTLCVIDVRAPHEWQALHIPGAVLIPKDEITTRIPEVTEDKKQPVYLHCRSGMRSMEAAETLSEMGYQTVYSVEGGILAWQAAGYPTASAS